MTAVECVMFHDCELLITSEKLLNEWVEMCSCCLRARPMVDVSWAAGALREDLKPGSKWQRVYAIYYHRTAPPLWPAG